MRDKNSLGNQYRWKQVKYIASPRSWREELDAATGLNVPERF